MNIARSLKAEIAVRMKDARRRSQSERLRREFMLRYQYLVLLRFDYGSWERQERREFLETLKQANWFDRQNFDNGWYPSLGRAYDEIHALYKEIDQDVARLESLNAITRLLNDFEHDFRNARRACDEGLRQFTAKRPRIFVCSDVHLGTGEAELDKFEQVLSLCESRDKLVLLGDILDFWVAGKNEKWIREEMASQWKGLFYRLELLQEAGVEIHYVPGNHDPFVFTLHSLSHVQWSQAVKERSKFIRDFDQTVSQKYRLTRILSIHYPYLKLEVADGSWLFTHGHMNEWFWSLFTPNSKAAGAADFPWSGAWLTSISTALAHRYASGLRRVFRVSELAANSEQFLADAGILITHEVIESYDAAHKALGGYNWTGFADEVELAFKNYVRLGSNDPRVMAIRNGLERLQRDYIKRDIDTVCDKEREWIKSHPSHFNYVLGVDGRDATIRFATASLKDFADFDHFVCGHYHKPRLLPGPPVRGDSGAMLRSVQTVLQINPDGCVGRPTF